MTKDFAKPSTTRKPGDKKKPGSTSSASSKTKKSKTNTKKSGAATLKPSTPAPQPKRTKPILLLIVLISAFSYGLYFLQTIPPTQSIPETSQNPLTRKETKNLEPATEKKTGTRFKFYDLLPESNIQPSEVDAYKFKEKNNQTDNAYLVQTGSFRNINDAERQKATIAYKGIKADIKVVTNNNGSKWYRVMAGP